MMSDDEECHLYMRDQNQPYLAVVAGVKTKHRLSFCPGWGWRGRGRPLEGTHALHCTADVCTASSPLHTHTHTHMSGVEWT